MTLATDTTVVARLANHRQRVALEAAIQDRWSYRTWYRTEARRMFARRWKDLEKANDKQIRLLVRQLRRMRATQTWTEPELREAFGR